MNILGIGPQIFIIALLALLLFGPKKMIQYAYQAGRYVAQLRVMWEQTMQTVSKEFKEAGLDVPPEMLSGRFDIGAEAMKVINKASTAAVVPTIAPPTIAPPTVTPTASETEAVSVPLMTLPTEAANIPLADANTESAANQPSLNLPTDDEQPRKYDAWLPS